MQKEKEEEIIDAAKSALKITRAFTPSEKKRLLLTQAYYLNWSADYQSDPRIFLDAIHEVEVASKKYLKNMRGIHLGISLPIDSPSLRGPEAVRYDLQLLKHYRDGWLPARFSTSPKRGPRDNLKLHGYIRGMASWYYLSFGKPGYGTYSLFPKLVGDCLGIIDAKYKDKPPLKAIVAIVKQLNKKRGEKQ